MAAKIGAVILDLEFPVTSGRLAVAGTQQV